MVEKKLAPAVTKYSDHEVIVVPNRLKKAVRVAGLDPAERDPVTSAEEALEQLSSQFENWMDEECERLDSARRLVHEEGFTDPARQNLFRAAHDIKGHAATLGFPTAADVAETLSMVIEHISELSKLPLSFVDHCVDAVRAIIRERDRTDAHRTAATLARELRTMAHELIELDRDSNSDAPAPLAPT